MIAIPERAPSRPRLGFLAGGQDCAFEAAFYGTKGGAALRNVGGSFHDSACAHATRARTGWTSSRPCSQTWADG